MGDLPNITIGADGRGTLEYEVPNAWVRRGATPMLDAAAPGYDRAGELAALTSPRVAGRLRDLGLTPSCFRDFS